MKKSKHIFFLLLFFAAATTYAQKTATVFGKITNADGQPVEDASVSIMGVSGAPTYTSKDGKFEIKIPADKKVTVVILNLNYQIEKITVQLKEGERKEISPVLKVGSRTKLDSIVIEDRMGRAQGAIRIDPKIISSIPTASGDFNAILFTLPGVSSRNELSSSYSVRGGNFDENLVYVNDIEVYRPFLVRSGQQEGLSFVNGDLVSSIIFSAGGFEAKYGDKMSSVLDIQYKRPRSFGGSVSGSLLGSNLHFEGASKDYRFTWLLGARYKTNQYLLGTLDTQGDYKPLFTDVQTYLTYDLSDTWEIAFLGNYASNKYNIVPQTRETTFGTIKEALRFTVYFDGQEIDKFQTYMGGLTARYHPNDKLNLKFITSAFKTQESETFDIQGQYRIDELENDFGDANFGNVAFTRGVGTYLNHARNYLDAYVFNVEHKGNYSTGKNNLLWGVKYQSEMVYDKLSEWKYVDSAGYSLPVGSLSTIDLQDVVKTKINVASNRMSGYVQKVWNKELQDTSEIFFTAGIRANYWDLNNQVVVSPRLTFAYKPNWKKDILFRASSGYYYQPPFYRELRDLRGVLHPDLKAQESIHFVLGSDLNFKAWNRPFKFTAEGYYKYLNNLIPYEVDNVRIRYYAENSGRGYATGLDLKVNGEFVKGIESWASLSIMNTKEDIKNDYYYDYYNSDGEKIISGYTFNNVATDSVRHEPGSVPRPTDQLVTFAIMFQDYLPRWPDFKMHLNLVFGTGVPFGPPTFERYKDTLRMPPYRRVDIGFSYQILKEGKKLSAKNPFRFLKSAWASLEVFNLLQVNNTISYTWVKDVTDRQYAIPNYLTRRQLNLRVIFKF